MTTLDWIALAVIALGALIGFRAGLLTSALSVAGVIGGAYLGARLAPHFLSGGDRSPYTPLVALAGAVVLAILFETIGSVVGSELRSALRLSPLRALDSAGGLVLGAAAGLVVVWVIGAVALNLPGQRDLRRSAQRSVVLRRLNEVVPPARLLAALERIDPFPSIVAPLAPVGPPDPKVLARPGVRQAAPSVVRILGTACGLGVEGSGWVAAPHLVVTAAHVVAGQSDTVVEAIGTPERLDATAVAFDRRNDVAVLRVPGLEARPLGLVDPEPGRAVAILGYPNDGPFDATPGRIGRTATVVSEDAYGHGPVTRTITSIRGEVEHGDSGGPAVDANGAVEATVFAARVGGDGGFGVPSGPVRDALASARGRVSTGGCAG